jgi:uncharacterized membrane protein
MSPLLATFLVITMMFVPALMDIGSINRARAEAQNIADAASLAAAQEMVRGGDPAVAATNYTESGGAALVSVVADKKSVVVAVDKPCPTILASRIGLAFGPVRGRGKAELKASDEPDY